MRRIVKGKKRSAVARLKELFRRRKLPEAHAEADGGQAHFEGEGISGGMDKRKDFEKETEGAGCGASGNSAAEKQGEADDRYDEERIREYLRENRQLLCRLAGEYLAERRDLDAPALLGNGARIVASTPADRPASIEDAGKLAEQYLKRAR